MGEVFLGRHLTLAMPVAIKVIRRTVMEHTARFEREALAMARVRHVNVVSIIDFGFHEDCPCIVMEYVEGRSLGSRLTESGTLAWSHAFEIGAQVLEGLAVVHAAGLVHRDVKPDNIMLTAGRPEIAKVLDFGIAKVTDPEAHKLTATGVAIGTPAYMPPEQLMGTGVGPATDIYALATSLWQAICGELPFGDEAATLARKLVEAPPPPRPPLSRPSLPDQAAFIIESMLQPSVRERPTSAAACADELRRLVGEFSVSALVPTARRPVYSAGDRADRRGSMPAVSRSVEAQRPITRTFGRGFGPRSVYGHVRGGTAPDCELGRSSSIDRVALDRSLPSVPRVDESPPRDPADPLPMRISVGRCSTIAPAGPLVLVARLPSGVVSRPEERRWLATHTAAGGRSYTLGECFWLVVEPCSDPTPTGVQGRLRSLGQRIVERFGDLVRLEGQLAPEDFTLTPAVLSGAVSMPEPIVSLLARLSSGG